ncbi:HAD family hydrolase [Streptomyces polygonati]|uniref:HAD family hydrolase n=1 Tax=Streptomyces polygonati TaxID=1617087 RepID=A0ABV8HL09_9ACTN
MSSENQPRDRRKKWPAAELVIFDCDGVLVDSEKIAVKVDVDVLAALGWPLTEEEIVERFVGRSFADMTADIERYLGRALPDGWDTPYRRLYREAFERELTPVDGVVEALDALTLPSCVASSTSHAGLRHTLGLTGLYERFAGRVFSAADVARGKPAPDLFLHAARSLGVEPARCLVVEDSRYGVEAARAAGMRSYGYYGGLTPAAWLEGPDTTVFDDMRKLPGLLGS